MSTPNVKIAYSKFYAETIYNHLLQNMFPSNEQKGCGKESSDTKDQLLTDKAIL